MRIELIKDAILGILRKTLPLDMVHHFLNKDEISTVEACLQAARDRALIKANEVKPWPGEAAKPSTEDTAPKKSYTPAGGFTPHYSDSKPLRAYKHIMKQFANSNASHHGHVDFNPKTEQIIAHTDMGKDMISQASKGAIDLKKPKENKPAETKTVEASAPVFGEK